MVIVSEVEIEIGGAGRGSKGDCHFLTLLDRPLASFILVFSVECRIPLLICCVQFPVHYPSLFIASSVDANPDDVQQ